MCGDLISHGVVPRKSLCLSWPRIDEDLMADFVRGFFDGDGGLSKDGSVSFTGNYEFILKLKEYLRTKIPIENDNKILKNSISDAYLYRFMRRVDVILFYHYIYKNSNLHLFRKKELFEKILNIC